MIQQQKKRKITELPRASNPYAEIIIKLYIFIHIEKELQIKIEMCFLCFVSVWLPFCNFQLRIDLKANKER